MYIKQDETTTFSRATNKKVKDRTKWTTLANTKTKYKEPLSS